MKHTILIVDDVSIFRELLSVALRHGGYDTLEASDGREALELLDRMPVSLILLDVAMPGMDGLTMLSRMRLIPRYRTLPVILLTAVAERDHVQRAAALGIHDYLLKSAFSLAELLARVAKGVSLHAQHGPSGGTLRSVLSARHAPPPERVVSHPTILRQPAAHAGAPSHGACATLEAPWPTAAHVAPPPARVAHKCPTMLTHDQTIARLQEAIAPNTAAGVIAQVLALASSPLSEMAELVRVIECDPVLAARVLQIGNSADLATAKPSVATIDEAARNIGFNGIYNIASSFGQFNAFPPDAADGFSLLRCWQHSLAVAEILPMIRAQTPECPRGTLHLIGLCHDLGEILLRQHFAVEYATILNFSVLHHTPVRKVEAAALSLSHHQLVSLALGQMTLPAAIGRPIVEFFETPHVLRDGSPVARALSLANYLAHALQLAPSVHARVRPITTAKWRSVAGEFMAPPAIDAALRARIVATTSVLARLNAQQDVALRQPLLARRPRQIRYVRHKMFCDPDPLAIALDSLAHVTICDQLPETAVEWQIDALVIVSPRMAVAPMNLTDIRQACVQAGRPDMPILCLVADDSLDAPPEGVKMERYPIELVELEKFVASIG